MFDNLRSFTYLYFGLLVVHLGVEFVDMQAVRLFTKPIFMVLLLVFHFLNAKGDKSYFSRMVRFGLLFSWFGDIALMFDKQWPIFFVVGLAAFLIGHVGYALAFFNSIRLSDGTINTRVWLASIFPFATFSAIFFFVMKDGIVAADPNLLIPVLAYTIVITVMGIMASLRHGLTAPKDYVWILAGAILFILSDVIIAVDKFMFDFDHNTVANGILYFTAQYLIMAGSLHYLAYRRGEVAAN